MTWNVAAGLLAGSFKQSTQKMPPPAFSIRMLLGISAEGRQQQSADEERIDMIVIDGERNQEAPLSRSGYVQNEEEERCSNPPLGSTTSSSITIHDNINDNVTFSHQNQQQFLMMQPIPPTVFFPFLGLPLLTKLRMQSFNRDHHRFVANEHILMDGHSTTTNFNSSFNSFEDKVLTNPSLSSAPVVMKRIHQQKQLQNESTNIVSCKRMGHPYQSRQHLGQKKPRTSFTRMQVSILERRFFDQKYLASSERAQLANQLAMEDSQVKTWFQNRRTKWRRQEAEGRKCGSR